MESNNPFEIDNLPNRLTVFRILLIPIVIIAMMLTSEDAPLFLFEDEKSFGWVAGVAFFIASLTDFFDGYIARKRNIVTIFGSFLDPIADKFLVVSSLIMLLSLNRLPDFVVIVLVLRELYMTSLRLFALNQGERLPVSRLGKWKTATQMIGIPMLMVYHTFFLIPFKLIGLIFIYIATTLSIVSAIIYSFRLIKKIQHNILEKKRNKRSNTISDVG